VLNLMIHSKVYIKRLLIGMLCICFANFLFSQDYQSIIDQARQLNNQSDFQEAIFLLNKVVKDKSISHETLFVVYKIQGMSNFGLSNYDQAIEFYQKAFQLSEEKSMSGLKQAEAMFAIGETQESMGLYEESMVSFNITEKILSVSEGPLKQELLINLNLGKGDYFDTKGIYLQADSCYEKALELVNQGSDSTSLSTVYNRLGYSKYSLGDIDQALTYFELALPIDLKAHGKFGVKYTSGLSNIGSILISKGNYDKALSYYNIALKNNLEKFGSDHFQLAIDYHNIGILHLYKGDYSLALDYFSRSKRIFNKTFKEDYHNLMTTLNKNIGLCYEESGEPEKALLYYNIALEKYHSNFPDGHAGISKILERIGKCKEIEGDLDAALDYYEQAFDIGNSFLGEDHHYLSNFLRSQALVYKKKGDYVKSKEIIDKSSALIEEKLGASHPLLAENYMHAAELVYFQNDYPSAIAYFDKATSILNYDPVKDPKFEKVNSEMLLLKVFEKKAFFYEQLYEKSKDESNLQKSLDVYTDIINLIQHLRHSYKEDESKRILTKNNYSLYSKAIKLCLDLNKINKQAQFLEKAFQFSERLKANKLLESFYASKAQSIAGIPDSILNQEKAFKVDIVFLKQQLEDTPQTDSASIVELNKRLLDRKQEYRFFISTLESQYGNYYNLKYSANDLTVTEIQKKLLNKDQTLIEYHAAENALYAFVINKDSIRAIELNIDSLSTNIFYLRRGLWSTFINYEDSPSKEIAKLLFKKYAFKLYKQLIEPLGTLDENLTIIPSGEIGTIPFEVLLTQKSDVQAPMNQLEYLIKSHEISYNFSALLWKEMRDKKYEEKGLLAVAPSFKTVNDGLNRNALQELNFTRNEATYISDLFRGDTLIGELATSASFIDMAKNYGILHLATHAQVNVDKIEKSCLYFYADSLNNQSLYIRDLYTMEFPADLVVLSACETGVGELIKGEGIVSLARGFAYAGASSIVTSLWRVRDNSTSEFMKLFYANLKKGDRKSEALRSAKLEFIDSNPKYAHPFYWAPFVGIGNMKKIDNSELPDSLTYVIGFLIIGALGYLFFWKGGASKENV